MQCSAVPVSECTPHLQGLLDVLLSEAVPQHGLVRLCQLIHARRPPLFSGASPSAQVQPLRTEVAVTSHYPLRIALVTLIAQHAVTQTRDTLSLHLLGGSSAFSRTQHLGRHAGMRACPATCAARHRDGSALYHHARDTADGDGYPSACDRSPELASWPRTASACRTCASASAEISTAEVLRFDAACAAAEAAVLRPLFLAPAIIVVDQPALRC